MQRLLNTLPLELAPICNLIATLMEEEASFIFGFHPTLALTQEKHVAGIEDLIREILLRLPAKSLIRFKLVSKRWLSLISDPKFAQSHSLRNPSSLPSGMFVDIDRPDIAGSYPLLREKTWKIDFFRLGGDNTDRDQSTPSFDFIASVFHEQGFEVSIFQSCNGLFLCSSTKDYENLCVCNPTTKQYRFLPPIECLYVPHRNRKRWRVSGVGFAFDPSISPHYYVICEKVTGGLFGLPLSAVRVEVYSSENHQWRLLSEFNITDQDSFDAGPFSGVFCNGWIRWLGRGSFHFDLNSKSLVQIGRMPPFFEARISLTLEEEAFDGASSIIPDKSVGVRDKYLYAISDRTQKLHVFEISKDYHKWVVKYSLNVCYLISVYSEIVTTKIFNGWHDPIFAAHALGVVDGLKEEDTVLILAIPDKIISYNFVKETAKTVYDFPAEPAEKTYIRAFPFIETLAPV